MPTICYVPKRFSAASAVIIEKANDIVREYAQQGFLLTLRQLYYQFVARGLIENTQRSYKRLGSIINDGRLAGLIDWKYITDRTRNLKRNSHWTSPADIMRGAAEGYGIDLWEGQPTRVEVWIEKDALVGVIEGICSELDVPFFSCRGYTSQSEMWSAAQRLARYRHAGQSPVIIHLGDHDPSGVDMTRDIEDRIRMLGCSSIEVERIALTMTQVEEYNPPPNPAKFTDSRCATYVEQYGTESWELDALDPQNMVALIRERVEARMDLDVFEARKERQEEERQQLTDAADRWEEIVEDFLGHG